MSAPLSPPRVTSGGRDELPAYVSNGLVGMRVLDVPLVSGVVLLNGFAGRDPVVDVESAARAPDPLNGDICLNGVWLTTSPQQAEFVEQGYDFASGELETVFTYRAAGVTATCSVLTLCSKVDPTIVAQEISVTVNEACDLSLRGVVGVDKIPGRMVRRELRPPGPEGPSPDGALSWEAPGGLSVCGVAYATDFQGDRDVQRQIVDWGADAPLATEYSLRARPDRTYRLRQIASLLPSSMHHDPIRAATRQVCRAAEKGFERVREESRAEWAELWKGRIIIESDDDRWQRLADAAFFYLNGSVHPSATSSTSIFGLAQWNDYHYYYGHVMWDIDLFCVPPLLFSQPDAARALLDYRSRTTAAARGNARLRGRRGLQFAWESGPLRGEEVAPGAGKAAWYEDHVSADVAWAFAQFAHVTGDQRFRDEQTAPVLYGVADWITSRVVRRGQAFAWPETMGIAERQQPSDNDAFTVMGARIVLSEAIACATQAGIDVPSAWQEVFAGLDLPRHSETGAILSHDRYHPNEEKGATPGPLAGIFPLWYPLPPKVAQRTLEYYLELADGYVGSPMLSALYGVWAAWAGNRRLAARLLDEGHAQLQADRFMQTLEQSPTRYPDKPKAGPFFANMGGFLMALAYGLPGIKAGPGPVAEWPSRPVVLPAGWRSIEIERAWVRGEPARVVARHGASSARIEIVRRPQTSKAARPDLVLLERVN